MVELLLELCHVGLAFPQTGQVGCVVIMPPHGCVWRVVPSSRWDTLVFPIDHVFFCSTINFTSSNVFSPSSVAQFTLSPELLSYIYHSLTLTLPPVAHQWQGRGSCPGMTKATIWYGAFNSSFPLYHHNGAPRIAPRLQCSQQHWTLPSTLLPQRCSQDCPLPPMLPATLHFASMDVNKGILWRYLSGRRQKQLVVNKAIGPLLVYDAFYWVPSKVFVFPSNHSSRTLKLQRHAKDSHDGFKVHAATNLYGNEANIPWRVFEHLHVVMSNDNNLKYFEAE